MGVFRFLKGFAEPVTKIPKWIDYEGLKYSCNEIGRLVKRLFIPAKSTYQETFSEAMARLQLSDDDIQQRQQNFRVMATVFGIVTLLIFFYTGYLFVTGSLHAGLMAMGLFFVGLGFTFDKHFWYVQIKHRTLGLSFKEWCVLSFKPGKQS